MRRTVKGKLQSLVYGLPASVALDPIEKKPLYHFLPGSTTLSLGTFGCNFTCAFCQNYELSQARDIDDELSRLSVLDPEAVVQLALRQGASSIACTYNEPAVWAEYALDIAVQARKAGLRTVFVSNGFYSRELLDEALPLIDAYNIDLKSFSDDFYRRVCGGRLQPVLDAIWAIHDTGAWEEITSLIIPGLNDSEPELRAMAHFVASIDPRDAVACLAVLPDVSHAGHADPHRLFPSRQPCGSDMRKDCSMSIRGTFQTMTKPATRYVHSAGRQSWNGMVTGWKPGQV